MTTSRKAQVTVQPMVLKFLFAFLFLAFVGMVFFGWAKQGATLYSVSDYNDTAMETLGNISDRANDSMEGLYNIVNPTNATNTGSGSPSTTDLLIGTAVEGARFLFEIPGYLLSVFTLTVTSLGIDPRIAAFGFFVVMAIVIAMFYQLAIGRG